MKMSITEQEQVKCIIPRVGSINGPLSKFHLFFIMVFLFFYNTRNDLELNITTYGIVFLIPLEILLFFPN